MKFSEKISEKNPEIAALNKPELLLWLSKRLIRITEIRRRFGTIPRK